MKKIYGITFPIATINEDNLYVDVDTTFFKAVKSKLLHLIKTNTKQKLRDPEFGLNLDKLLFNPNDEVVANEIITEINNIVNKYFTQITVLEIKTTKKEDTSITLSLKYSIVDKTSTFIDSAEITI